ncbi:uncharacterized protein [Rutidosis leptorrhynchoides]|uniref:uncharacterized protein n=1 Tax=Rutidosis leptorrhynchoides TaxID=125765 RepID=UPI003A98D261
MARGRCSAVGDGTKKCKNCGPPRQKADRHHIKNSKSASTSQNTSASFSINNVEVKEFGEKIGLRWPSAHPNSQGFGVDGKFGWVKNLCCNDRPDIAVFQETKCNIVEDRWVQSLWGSDAFGFVQKESVGNSGGMLIIWDSSRFKVNNAVGNSFFMAISGTWVGSGNGSMIVNVYGPHNDRDKKELWASLDNLLSGNDLPCVICGDFNEVRFSSDRLNSIFNHSRARIFNDFINRNSLVEVPLNGKRFTRICDNGVKFSKLDRFLINEDFMNLWEDLSVVALDRKRSDHCPLVLRDKIMDFGPKPFKVFDEWWNKEGVDKVIMDA